MTRARAMDAVHEAVLVELRRRLRPLTADQRLHANPIDACPVGARWHCPECNERRTHGARVPRGHICTDCGRLMEETRDNG